MGMGAAHQENYYKRRAASSYPLVDSPVILKKRAVDIKECNQAAASSCSIYRHLHALEMDVNKRPLSNYAETVQKEVTNQMREILVDWLVEVTEEFKLVSDTLYLAVSCVDRFLSIRPLNMKHLQLLGVSSILIAS
jgi:cyclin A